MSAKTRAQILARQFELHTRLYNNVLEGIDDTAASNRLRDSVNHVTWVAGHILAARWSLNTLAGVDDPNPYEDLFGHGKSIDDAADYPSLDALREKFNSISPRILNALENAPDEVLDSPKPVDVPIADDTMAGMLAFLMHHEAYHIGQLGILRKYITKDAMSYR